MTAHDTPRAELQDIICARCSRPWGAHDVADNGVRSCPNLSPAERDKGDAFVWPAGADRLLYLERYDVS